jgi:hypothetical protein
MKRTTHRPNSYQCEGCPEWDDLNGCWDGIKNVDRCLRIGESGYYGEFDDCDEDFEDNDEFVSKSKGD